LDKKFAAPTVTNDGVTIARDIELEDPFENMGAQLVKEVATKTNDVAGDGTTTATVLAQAMITEGLRNVAAGANPMLLKRGIDKGVEAIVADLQRLSKPVNTAEETAQVAAVSSGDESIGAMIALHRHRCPLQSYGAIMTPSLSVAAGASALEVSTRT